MRKQLMMKPLKVISGCRQWQSANPEQVHAWVSTNNRYRTDVDTLEDIEALATRTGHRLKWPVDLMVTA